MEFTTLDEAIRHASNIARFDRLREYFVLSGVNSDTGETIYWVCGPSAKAILWPELSPIWRSAAA